MPRYKPATHRHLEGLVQLLVDLDCYVAPKGIDTELCRQCDVKALAAVAGFLEPRVVEDEPPGGSSFLLEEPEFEELPY